MLIDSSTSLSFSGSEAPLNEGPLQLPSDPIDAFLQWFDEALKAGVADPTAMTLATASKAGRPSARIVLLKGTSVGRDGARGLEFFTNYASRKSQDLDENPQAALVFHWPAMRRQVRFEGRVEKLAVEESNAYFQTRPRGSRIGAWSSPQSRPISSREELEHFVRQSEERFKESEIPCPPFWGGWRLIPDHIEFWEERPFRLHERLVFDKNAAGWFIARLAP